MKNILMTCCPTAPPSELHFPVLNAVPKPGMGVKGREKEKNKPQVLSNSHFLPLRHKEIKGAN